MFENALVPVLRRCTAEDQAPTFYVKDPHVSDGMLVLERFQPSQDHTAELYRRIEFLEQNARDQLREIDQLASMNAAYRLVLVKTATQSPQVRTELIESEVEEDRATFDARFAAWKTEKGFEDDTSPHLETKLTPLLTAVREGELSFTKRLFPHATSGPLNRTAAFYAAMQGHLDVLLWLYAQDSACLGHRDENDDTVANAAAFAGRLSVLVFLDREGALREDDFNNDGNNVTLAAAMGGHVHVLVWLKSLKFSLFCANCRGDSIATLAASMGHTSVLQWMSIQDLPIYSTNDEKKTALFIAAEGGHLQTVLWLLKSNQGFRIDDRLPDGSTLLHLAARQGNLELLESFGTLFPSHLRSHSGATPMMVAAQHGHLDAVRWMQKLEPDCLSDTDDRDNDVLLYAASGGAIQVFEHLAPEFKGWERHRTRFNESVFTKAAGGGHLEFLKKLPLDTNDKELMTSLVLTSASQGHIDVLTFLQENGAPINAPLSGNLLLVHIAAQEGHLSVLQWAESLGQDVRTPVLDTLDTPLLLACRHGHNHVIPWLLLRSSETDRNAQGMDPVLQAAAGGHLSTVIHLAFQGHSLKKKTAAGNSVAHIAAMNGYLDLLRWLVCEKPQLLTQKRTDSETCLSLAAWNRQHEVVEWIVATQIEAFDDFNRRFALLSAAIGGHEAIFALLATTVDPKTPTDKHGSNALHLAAAHGHLQLVQLLVKKYHFSPLDRNSYHQTSIDLAVKHPEVHAYLSSGIQVEHRPLTGTADPSI